jgi:peptidoglycan hydrolase CwlO-like protein
MTFGNVEVGLLEVLLSVILMFNVGAYTFLWTEHRRLRGKVSSNRANIKKLIRRIFGMEEDDTDEGYLVEAEEEFDNINQRLDSIEHKIDEVQNKNEKAHSDVMDILKEMSDIIIEEENIDAGPDDIPAFER